MPNEEGGAQHGAAENDVPVAMRKVYRRLERWRLQRTGRERIPESLWAAAGELAREHGVNQLSRALRLEFNHLKRVAKIDRSNNQKRFTAEFVELIAPQTSLGRENAIELEGSRGKLRIKLKGTEPAELVNISRTLWELLA